MNLNGAAHHFGTSLCHFSALNLQLVGSDFLFVLGRHVPNCHRLFLVCNQLTFPNLATTHEPVSLCCRLFSDRGVRRSLPIF